LSRTFPSAGNQKTWTWSAWVKRGTFSGQQIFFDVSDTYISFDSNAKLNLNLRGGGTNYFVITTAVYRDPSAWYHVVFALDTTQASSGDRAKLYVNGQQVTVFDTFSPPPQNDQPSINSTSTHYISSYNASGNYFDGYLTEINFIDGQALDPSYFGETDVVTGVWKPIKYTGSYGTNGFYLPMTPTSQAEGFNSILYYGHPSNSAQSIDGVGFSPDLVWIKSRVTGYGHCLSDSVRGATKRLQSDTTGAEATSSTYISSLDADGFSLGTDYGQNAPNEPYVAWCWDAGSGSPASNTDGSITSTVKANQAKGFSIVTYTGNGSAGATWGHGLGVAPNFIMIKARDVIDNWMTKHSSYPSNLNFIELNTTNAVGSATDVWNNTAPTSSVVTVGTGQTVNKNASSYVAYCFAEVAGYSKIGSYTGTGASGNSITTGFKPAWLLIKRTDSADKWTIRDGVRSPFNPIKLTLNPNSSIAEYTPAGEDYDFDSNGFTLNNSNGAFNASGGNYIYMAIADTRNTAFNNDASGNKNNWTPNNINSNASGQSTYDLMTDVFTLTSEDAANYATLNPLSASAGGLTFSNGNLTITPTVFRKNCKASLALPNTGKYYWEWTFNSTTGASAIYNPSIAPVTSTADSSLEAAGLYAFWVYTSSNVIIKYNNTRARPDQAVTWSTSDVMQFAVDMDTRRVWLGKNNAWFDTSTGTTGNPSAGTNYLATLSSDYDYAPSVAGETTGITSNVNFGQRPFAYTPPTGFKALNTYNLPDSTVKDGGDYFNPVLYTGNGSTQSITGVGFQPDVVWIKGRSYAEWHALHTSLLGTGKFLKTQATDAEVTNRPNCLTSFDSDGFTVGNEAVTNSNGQTYVAWNWKANGSGVSNTDGSITSTVSANTTSGFSIVTYTGTGSTATVGHGLGVTPSMIFIKVRNQTSDWPVYHVGCGATAYLNMNETRACTTNSAPWNNTAPTSSVFTVGSSFGTNWPSGNLVAYCFAPIEGFSAFGSYTGNGSTDGPFVYTGFRPAFVLFKNASGVANWFIYDTQRSIYNQAINRLFPNTSDAEDTNTIAAADINSNGFKVRNTSGTINTNGSTYIYAAFAENPFKNSLAR
jgi:hypothetical protein